MGIRYSINPDPDKTAKALGKEMAIKSRSAIEVCRALRGLKVADAKQYLEDVQAKKRAIPYRRHMGQVGHRKGIGPGKYPVKVCAAVGKVLAQAEANAEYKGLEPDDLVVVHAAAQRAGQMPGHMPRARGRATAWNTDLTHIEIVVEEREN